MNVSRNANVTTLLSVFAIGATTAFAFMRALPRPPLDHATALALVTSQWGGCTGQDCTSLSVDVGMEHGEPVVTATYSGYQDDSVRGMRIVAKAKFDPSASGWTLLEKERLWSCQADRGHKEWSAELCI